MMKWISFLALAPLLSFALPLQPGETFRVQIPGEYIVKATNQKALMGATVKRNLGAGMVLVEAHEKSMAAQKGYPNYAYYGNYMEEADTPNDELFAEQFHHQMILTNQAWTATSGSAEIVVAVTDNEFKMDHADLQGQWWTNSDEIAGNGIDDDGNGYVDDINGWDFVQQDNDMDADTSTHGTHVSGIIAAKANNKIGGAGIAPNVKVMALRWYGSERPWTSALVAETYNYAVDNGANIVNTSYNIDRMADDEAYREAVRYAAANDVIIFNSAGNGRRMNPNRQKVEEVVLVCAVKSGDADEMDRKAGFSNYGTGIDVCAPGDPILAPVNRTSNTSAYGELSGTSMASPVAAAVAALIWSHNPNFTAEEVKQRLYESADNIDEANPSRYHGMLGAGRVNAFNALQ